MSARRLQDIKRHRLLLSPGERRSLLEDIDDLESEVGRVSASCLLASAHALACEDIDTGCLLIVSGVRLRAKAINTATNVPHPALAPRLTIPYCQRNDAHFVASYGCIGSIAESTLGSYCLLQPASGACWVHILSVRVALYQCSFSSFSINFLLAVR